VRYRSSLVRAVVGAAISVAAIWLVLRSVDVGRAVDVLRTADRGWIGLMAGFILIDLAVRGLRWQRLVAPIGHVGYPAMLAYLLVGYLANNVLPARIGELVRSHYLGDREGLSRTTTLGTVVVERVVDFVVVVAIASAAIIVLSVRGVVASAVLVGIAVQDCSPPPSRSGSPPIGCLAPSGSPRPPSDGRGRATSRASCRAGWPSRAGHGRSSRRYC